MTQPARRMFRYEVPMNGEPHDFELTHSPVAVAAPVAYRMIEFWAEHDDAVPPVRRAFQVFGTGHMLPPDARWVGTADRVDGLVWHLYELVGMYAPEAEEPGFVPASPQVTP